MKHSLGNALRSRSKFLGAASAGVHCYSQQTQQAAAPHPKKSGTKWKEMTQLWSNLIREMVWTPRERLQTVLSSCQCSPISYPSCGLGQIFPGLLFPHSFLKSAPC